MATPKELHAHHHPVVVPTPKSIELWPCFSIFDSAAQRYSLPQSAPTEDVALRQFSDLCSTPGGVHSRHPSDFDLFYCGDWDSVACEFVKSPKRHICNGKQVVVEDSSNGS